jgi:ABC-type transporter Mla subunit MlaD
MEQTVINWALAAVSGLIGVLLRSLWQAVRDLQAADKLLSDRVNSVEVLVAGDYVRRVDLDRAIEAVMARLSRIEDKLDRKADKDH